MKKLLIFLCLFLITKNVYAANYTLKELIPVNTETTIVTDNFSYKGIYYDGQGHVNFKSIKNISNRNLPLSISVALFDEKRINIGTYNYCDEENIMEAKTEKYFSLELTSKVFAKNKKVEDVHYISVLNDNVTCKKTGAEDYAGQKIEDIGKPKSNQMDKSVTIFIRVFSILGLCIVTYFVYRLLFTKSFENMNGEDIRRGYEDYNKELKREREEELKNNPPPPPLPTYEKADDIIKQELEAQKEDKEGTELHNLYK